MTALGQVRRARRELGVLTILTALMMGAGVAFGALVAAMLLSLAVPLPPEARAVTIPGAIAAGLTGFTVVMWRRRFAWSLPRVALWVEERAPELHYALVTAIDPRYADRLGERLAPAIARADPGFFVRRAAPRALLPAALILIVTGVSYSALPRSWRDAAVGAGPATAATAPAMPSRLDDLSGSVTPPRYARRSGFRREEFADPATISGLAGSTVDLHGDGTADGLEIHLGGTPVAAAPEGTGGWRATFTMPDSAEALELRDRQYRRLVVIDPRRDASPSVALLLPARDTTVRVIEGDITLHARMSDDIGLGGAFFESIVTMGREEGHITFRRDTLESRTLGNARDGELSLTLPLSHFALEEGDMLSLRAVAFDNNDLSGPSHTTSETRVLRLATSSEYDSLAVEGAPPPDDSLFLTLRFVIQLTEEVHEERRTMDRDLLVDTTQAIGMRLRRIIWTVEQMQDEWTMDGVFDPNPLLAEAHEALWEGARALYIAETGEALPPMWAALGLLQEFALAERYYFRGRPPELMVNLGRVRMQGKDTGYAAPRARREMSGAKRRELLARYVRSVRLLEAAPDSALNTLMRMQVDALREFPALASELGEAVAAIRAGDDATARLNAVRRSLEGGTIIRRRLTSWSALWEKR